MLQVNVMTLDWVMCTFCFLVCSFIERKQEKRPSLSYKIIVGIIQDEKYKNTL